MAVGRLTNRTHVWEPLLGSPRWGHVSPERKCGSVLAAALQSLSSARCPGHLLLHCLLLFRPRQLGHSQKKMWAWGRGLWVGRKFEKAKCDRFGHVQVTCFRFYNLTYLHLCFNLCTTCASITTSRQYLLKSWWPL